MELWVCGYSMVTAAEEFAGSDAYNCALLPAVKAVTLDDIEAKYEALRTMQDVWGDIMAVSHSLYTPVFWHADGLSYMAVELDTGDYTNPYQILSALPSLKWVVENVDYLRDPTTDPKRVDFVTANHHPGVLVWAHHYSGATDRTRLVSIDLDSIATFVEDACEVSVKWLNWRSLTDILDEHVVPEEHEDDVMRALVLNHMLERANCPDKHAAMRQVIPAEVLAELKLAGLLNN